MKKPPIEVFGKWAELGKDKGMEQNHKLAVENMIAYATKGLQQFSCIDAGCGNGWVVRKLVKNKACQKAIGVDGAPQMVEKAKQLDPKGTYYCADLMQWTPPTKVDLVHSMEVIYYLESPAAFLKRVHEHWLTPKGRLILGLDFYFENTVSHSWPETCGVSRMQLFSTKDWLQFFQEAGFKNIASWHVDEKENWAGTLVITGTQ